MEGPTSAEIREYMQKIFKTYAALREKKCAESAPFWDAVVLTTFDEAQRMCFLEQVKQKKEGGQLPQVPIYVVADPPGEKLGVGGSTLHVLSELSAEFGEQLHLKKLLIIHSGGSSQRLPSYSVLGKIFTPVPVEGLCVGGEVPQMLDLKLAMYLPLCRILGPGVLVTCADDIETYCLDTVAVDSGELAGADIMALGHPSSLEVGTGHGVYVLGNGAAVACTSTTSIQECLEVLQKPSVSAMRASGAVFRRGGGENEQLVEEVWSDSVFWLGAGVCRRLTEWYMHNRPLNGELDAYSHILPCLGVRMASAEPEDYSDFRSQMLPLLRKASFKVIALPKSKFYHLGTMEEYVENFNTAQDFITELGIVRNTSNMRGKVCVECVAKQAGEGETGDSDGTTQTPRSLGTIIESRLLTPEVRIRVTSNATRYVIEHCQIGVTLRLNGDVILSNCAILSCPEVPLSPGSEVRLPSNTLFHTAPIKQSGFALYVTVAFDIDACMKAEWSDLKDVRTFGRTLKDVVNILGLREEDVRQGEGKVSVWNARIFPAAATAPESFWLTLRAVSRVKGECEGLLGMCGQDNEVEECGRAEGVLKGCGREKLIVERCGRKEGVEQGCEEAKEGVEQGCEEAKESVAEGYSGQLFSMKDVVQLKDLATLLGDRRSLVLSLGAGDVAG